MATEGRPIGNLVINATMNDAGVNRGITGLKNNLKTAKSATNAMVQELKSVGDELGANKKQLEGYSNQLKIQERIVEEYNKAYQQQVEQYGEGSDQAQKYAQRLNSQIQTYQSLQGSIRRTETAILRLEQAENSASDSTEQLSNRLRGTGDATEEAHDKTSNFSSFIKKGMVGALAAGVAGVGALTAALGGMGAKMALDTQKTQGEFRAQLGLTKVEAQNLTKAATSVWRDGFGENMDSVKESITQVRQNIKGLSDDELKQVTKDSLVLADIFDADVNEVTRAGNNIMKGFGVSTKKAFDLMTYGAQNGLNFSNEMFDNLSEYAPLFGKMGFSAQEYFQLLKKGTDSGVYNLDYINDVMKEFQIRVKDGSDSTSGAMSQLSGKTQKVWQSFLKGKGTVKDVSNAVLGELKGMKNQVDANNIGVALYGTKWEDLESDAMYSLGGINGKIGEIDGKTKTAGQALQDNFGARLKKIGRSAMSALLPIGTGLLNVLEPAMNGLETGMKGLEPTFKKISDAGSNVKKVFSGIFDIFNGDTSKGADKLMDFFPVLTVQKIIDGINSIKTAFNGFKQQAQPIITNMKSSFDAMKPTFTAIGTIASQVFATLAPLIKQALGGVMSFIGQLTGQWKTFWAQNGTVITQALQNVWKVVQFVMPAVLAIIQSVWGNIKGVITGAISIIQGVIKVFAGLLTGNFSKMWEGIKQIFSGAIKVVWNAIQLSFFGKIIGGAKALGAGLKGIFPKMWGWIKSLFKDGATNAGKMFTYLKDKAFKIVGDMKKGIVKKFWEIVDAAKSLPKKMGDGIKEMGGKAWSGIKDFGNRTLRGFGKIINGFTQQGINWILGKIGVDFKVPKWEVPQYAHGTGSHQGGLAILGDGRGANAGSEAYITPSGHVGLSPATDTLMNLPKGTQVLSALETKVFLSGIPAYANGTKKKEGFISKMWNGAKAAVGKVKDLALDVFDYMTNPSKLISKVIEKLGIKLPDVKGVTGEVLKGSFSVIKDKFVGFIKGKFGESSNFGKGGTEAVKKWVAQALKIKGLGNEFSSALETIAMMESGGNPNVVNRWDSNWKAGHPSQGLMQFIPSTFEAHKEKGYGNIKNPVHQILASINYLNSRYGGVLNHPGLRSMAKGGKYVGYDKGGLITRDHMAEVHRGELILPLRKFRRTQAHKVLSQAANMVGYKPEAQQSNTGNDSETLSQIQQLVNNQQTQIDQQNQVIGLLMKLVVKDPQVNLNIQDLNKFQDKAYYAEKNQKGLLNNVSFT
ncbi:phage tail tape measure protein [Bacillus halotolerans]|uniref:phage tail tape measure protein n=1 Tax=Bacillus halotolerans TaxID=260554 RepID=UPI002DBD68FD|nr:phage tail tape measure protein [Bacillus halotolerans]MEC1663355.1 phage tail tape measure protein [Bacillus halotolerans]